MRRVFTASVATLAAMLPAFWLLPTNAAGQTAPANAQALPRTPDGKPDWNGVWAGPAFSHKDTPDDTDAPAITRYKPTLYADLFRPGGRELFYQKWVGDLRHDDPQSVCLPVGFPRIALSPYSQQIVQGPGVVVILYEYNHFTRVIPTDGRPHAKDIDLTWMGDPVGKWEGDTLVVDTIGLKEWPIEGDTGGGSPQERITPYHSDALHVIERFKPTSPTTISLDITIDDPKVFTKPWTSTWGMKRHPTWKLLEQVCEENNRCEAGHCVGSGK